MTLTCRRCHVRLTLERREPVCPYCKQETTWLEALTEWDHHFLAERKLLWTTDGPVAGKAK